MSNHNYVMATQIHRTIYGDSAAHNGDLVGASCCRAVPVGNTLANSGSTYDELCGAVLVDTSTTFGAIGLLLATGHHHSQDWSQPSSTVVTHSAAGSSNF